MDTVGWLYNNGLPAWCLLHIGYNGGNKQTARGHAKTLKVSIASLWKNHDCTFKESLYSTHPYLILLNKKSSFPVMTWRSVFGHRENISTHWSPVRAVAKSRANNSFQFDPRIHILNRPPTLPTPPTIHICIVCTYIYIYMCVNSISYKSPHLIGGVCWLGCGGFCGLGRAAWGASAIKPG